MGAQALEALAGKPCHVTGFEAIPDRTDESATVQLAGPHMIPIIVSCGAKLSTLSGSWAGLRDGRIPAHIPFRHVIHCEWGYCRHHRMMASCLRLGPRLCSE